MWFRKSINLQEITYLFTFIISTIAVISLQSDRYNEVTEQLAKPDYLKQERDSLIAFNLKKVIPTFGFDNLVADSIYLEFVQYFGDEAARKATGYSLVPEYFAAIVDRDPLFTEAYITLSAANSMYAGKADKTIELMERILRETPNENQSLHLIWSLKAMDETIFLGDINAAKYSYQQAAQSALQYYNESSTAVTFNREKVQFLSTDPDPTATQITAWNSVLPHVVKESERAIIRDRISNLEAK